MSTLSTQIFSIRPASVAEPSSPDWLLRLFGSAEPTRTTLCDRITQEMRTTASAAMVEARVLNARSLTPAEVQQATTDAYLAIFRQTQALSANSPVRFWNYIPGIHQPSGVGPTGEPLDRYMVFNAGRYEACKAALGDESTFARLLATASGVGHGGGDLIIHALATTHPGVAVENPRQVPAYHYSRRYGPRPPCFARATVATLNGEPMVLVGGTASVRGEASVHIGDLPAQVDETFANLAALLRAAGKSVASADDVELLHRFTHVRIYYVRQTDLQSLRAACSQAFGSAELEFVPADLCRQDLLVEIEGIARTE